jgi:Ser/Thr protein kinase RdoA (MazF antagonist)
LASDTHAIQAAAEGLAKFHWNLRVADGSEAPCRSAFEYLHQLVGSRHRNGTWPIRPSLLDEWSELGPIRRLLPFSVETAAQRLAPFCGVTTRVQPIHGDARPEHFLVSGGRLTGLIDFGAMRRDTVLADVARLAGELALGDTARRDEVVGYYETSTERPIDREAVAALDLAGAVLSAANWLRWLGEKQASAFDPELVRQRLQAIAARLIA